MSLRENLGNTNPEDFIPIEKCVELIASFREHSVYAFPHGGIYHVKDQHLPTGYFDTITLRLFRKGNVNVQEDNCFMHLVFIGPKLVVQIGMDKKSREYLDVLADSLEVKIKDEDLEITSDPVVPGIMFRQSVFNLADIKE